MLFSIIFSATFDRPNAESVLRIVEYSNLNVEIKL